MCHIVYTRDPLYGFLEFMSFKTEDDLWDFVDNKNYIAEGYRILAVHVGTCGESTAGELDEWDIDG